jgi:hypothetical protein
MERPWTYYLLLVVAWLAGLWGLWQIGDAWVTWPAIDSAAAREVARGKLWLAGGLIFGGVALGALATLIRLVQDGFAQHAPLRTEARAEPIGEPRAEPKATAPAPKIEPPLPPEPKREIRLEPALRLSSDAPPPPREPRVLPRPGEAAAAERREPKFLRDS